MLNTYAYFGDELECPIKVLPLNESETNYDFGESHRHDYFEMFFFEKGGGSHDIDFYEFPVKKHSVHIVSARKVHLLKRAPSSKGFILLFKKDMLSPATEGAGQDFIFLHQNEVINLKSDAYASVEYIVKDLKRELEIEQNNNYHMASTMLHLLILKLIKYNELAKNDTSIQLKNELYCAFIAALEENFAKESSTSFYANFLNISHESLNKEIKKLLGKTTSEIISERRLLEGKRLLRHSNLSVKEIAAFLHFSDLAHFSHFFKSKMNLSPTQYRVGQFSV